MTAERRHLEQNASAIPGTYAMFSEYFINQQMTTGNTRKVFEQEVIVICVEKSYMERDMSGFYTYLPTISLIRASQHAHT